MFDKSELKRIEALVAKLDPYTAKWAGLSTTIAQALGLLVRTIEANRQGSEHEVSLPRGPLPPGQYVATPVVHAPRRVVVDKGDGKVAGAARRMLQVLATRNLAGRTTTRVQLATLAGLSHKSGTFATYLAQLNVAGFIEKHANGEIAYSPSAAGRRRAVCDCGEEATVRCRGSEDVCARCAALEFAGPTEQEVGHRLLDGPATITELASATGTLPRVIERVLDRLAARQRAVRVQREDERAGLWRLA
jgi:hypothetical protein